MRPIPQALREKLSKDPHMSMCARMSGECGGRITFEHAFIYGGKQINEAWAIVPLCWYHHLGEGLNKEENQRLALERATEEDLAKYPRKDWKQLREYLCR